MSKPRLLLEVCVDSVDDAAAAVAGGADRLELNSALTLDGLTPSLGLVSAVRRVAGSRVPVVAMARPRHGGFCYGAADFRVMLRDIDLMLAHGADGIAFGILTAGRELDIPRCRQVVRRIASGARGAAARSQGAVFHKAFDVVRDPFRTLEQLIDLGVRRVMTSGQQPTAALGSAVIARLVERAKGRIEILPAGGVRPANADAIVAATGCDQLHSSLRDPGGDRLSGRLLQNMAKLLRRR